jgi:hypothetical protein
MRYGPESYILLSQFTTALGSDRTHVPDAKRRYASGSRLLKPISLSYMIYGRKRNE